MNSAGVYGRIGQGPTIVFLVGVTFLPSLVGRTVSARAASAVVLCTQEEGSHMLPAVPPFLVGVIAAPLAKRVAKPLVRGVIKTSVGLTLEVKRAVIEAGEEIQGLTALAAAEKMASSARTGGVESAAR
ncbi:DUF5132 domain-containing protein [Streptomyces sp. NBC_00328]|uniref:DUF5132 domain-containing protein n=1 Tax=Streptomyces sp. NBC_00328 TaxID=2903646 RepID=UPI002E2E7724|nr:DUF5132 domain-containing protein [Streptomyces sp. NBC_00328]